MFPSVKMSANSMIHSENHLLNLMSILAAIFWTILEANNAYGQTKFSALNATILNDLPTKPKESDCSLYAASTSVSAIWYTGSVELASLQKLIFHYSMRQCTFMEYIKHTSCWFGSNYISFPHWVTSKKQFTWTFRKKQSPRWHNKIDRHHTRYYTVLQIRTKRLQPCIHNQI